MEKEKFLKEGVDLKRLFLLFIKRLWIIVLSCVAGALIGALLYSIVTSITNGETKYRVSNDYYITFNFSEFENSTDYYNAYTWDSILRDDPIVNEAAANLPTSVSKEQIRASVSGEMLGDYRILTVNVITTDPELSKQIADAYTKSLDHFAGEIDMLESVKVWSEGEPKQLLQNTRTMNAAFLGGLQGLLLSILVLAIYYALDDAVYVETDFNKRYDIPFLGIVTDKKDERYLKELKDNYEYICGRDKKYYLVNTARSNTSQNPCVPLLCERCKGITGQLFIPDNGYEEIRKADGVILLVPYGQTNGKIMTSLILQLKKQDCNIAGVILTDADDRFLKQYYLGRRNR